MWAIPASRLTFLGIYARESSFPIGALLLGSNVGMKFEFRVGISSPVYPEKSVNVLTNTSPNLPCNIIRNKLFKRRKKENVLLIFFSLLHRLFHREALHQVPFLLVQ